MKNSFNRQHAPHKFCWMFAMVIFLLGCNAPEESISKTNQEELTSDLEMLASDEALVKAFNWAKNKALSYAHDGSDPVGYWYEAALPNREAFCMRDVSHQVIGAEILGLSKHNFNMLQKFAENISPEKDYCSYWEINRQNKPAPVDYENDKDFWYNLPANFDVLSAAYRAYLWSGNKAYLEDPDLINFYELTIKEYVDHWDLGHDEILARDRSLNLPGAAEGASSEASPEGTRFGKHRGIPTYNEGGRGETILGIDMTASLISAYKSYSEMLKLSGEPGKAEEYLEKARSEQEFLDEFWWDRELREYRSIWYSDKTFDYFMVGDNQAFLHYLYYFEAISDQEKITGLVEEYASKFDELIVELQSYLPIMFYENGKTALATKMIIDLCGPGNQRRDYPENSFTVIEHLTRGLMGINVDAASNTFSTLSRLEDNGSWVEMKNIPLLSGKVSVKHYGTSRTIVSNLDGQPLKWQVQVPGIHKFLYVNGVRESCSPGEKYGQQYSFCTVDLESGDQAAVSIEP